MKGLTLNLEPNVGYPHASRDCYDDLVPVPNGDADDAHEQLPQEDGHSASNTKQDIHAEHNQKGRSSKGHVRKDLKKRNYQQIFIPQTGRIGRHAHKLENGLDLRVIAYQGVGAHEIEDTIYLAIGVGCNVQNDEAKYDGQESGQTSSGIDLQKCQ
jgi:hypothetical protein